MRHTFRLFLGAALGVSMVAAAARSSHAQPASKPKVTRACGSSAIPLVVGNEWVYGPVSVPGAPPPDPQDNRKYPQRAKKIVIDVVGVETQNNTTTVQLEEDVDGRKLKTTITCTADKFLISPDSFFFAGEPGGSFHVDWTQFDHKPDATTLKLVAGKLVGPDWRDDVVGTWKQTPTQGADPALWAGKLEIERAYRVAGTDNIATAAGNFYKAQRVTLDITGRVTLDPPDPNPFEFPANFQNKFWFADGTGVVQVENSYGQGHMYQLQSMKLQK